MNGNLEAKAQNHITKLVNWGKGWKEIARESLVHCITFWETGACVIISSKLLSITPSNQLSIVFFVKILLYPSSISYSLMTSLLKIWKYPAFIKLLCGSVILLTTLPHHIFQTSIRLMHSFPLRIRGRSIILLYDILKNLLTITSLLWI